MALPVDPVGDTMTAEYAFVVMLIGVFLMLVVLFLYEFKREVTK